MCRIWYWARIDRDNDGRFVATIPDLGYLAAYGGSDNAAVAYLTDLARDRVRSAVEAGQSAPPRRHFTKMPSSVHAKEIGRATYRWKSSAEQPGRYRPTACPQRTRRDRGAPSAASSREMISAYKQLTCWTRQVPAGAPAAQPSRAIFRTTPSSLPKAWPYQ